MSTLVYNLNALQDEFPAALDGDLAAGAAGTLDHQVVDFHRRVAGPAMADGLWLLEDEFGVGNDGAWGQQSEGEVERLAVDAREPADAHFQPRRRPMLPRPLQFLSHLVNQGLDDG